MRKVSEGEAGGVMVGHEPVVDLVFAVDVAFLADSWQVIVGIEMKM